MRERGSGHRTAPTVGSPSQNPSHRGGEDPGVQASPPRGSRHLPGQDGPGCPSALNVSQLPKGSQVSLHLQRAPETHILPPQRVPGVPPPPLQHHKGTQASRYPSEGPRNLGTPRSHPRSPLPKTPGFQVSPQPGATPPSSPPQAYVVGAAAIALPLLHTVGDEANGRCHPHQALEPPGQLPPELDALWGPPGGPQLVGAVPQQPLSRHCPHQALQWSARL